MDVALSPITSDQRAAFERLAVDYFSEFNPSFVPNDDWRANYFRNVTENPDYEPRWIACDGERAGFVLYGVQPHRFLTRRIGWIFELYVVPTYRGRGVATVAAKLALEALRARGIDGIQLEVLLDNAAAAGLWSRLGFEPVSERWVLRAAPGAKL